MDRVVDQLGLVIEGEYLTCFIPSTSRAFVFRVKSRVNRRYEELFYGPLPLSAGDTLPTYEGGSVSVPADGVIPARSYTEGLSFPMSGAYDEGDMWYLSEDYRDRVFHVLQYVTPGFLRVDVEIPVGVSQGRFQKDKIVTGVDKDFGFSRGFYEIVHLPRIHYGYRYGNDTNIDLYASVRFVYGEYIVEIPRSANLIFDILTRRIPSHWVTMPLNVMDPTVEMSLNTVYGITGFPVYRLDQRDAALKEYESLLRGVKI